MVRMIKLNQKVDKIKAEWDALKPREKRALVDDDPSRVRSIRDKFYKAGYLKEGKEIISLENRSFGLKGQELKEANKTENDYLYRKLTLGDDKKWIKETLAKYKKKLEKLPIKNAEKKLKKMAKKYGISMPTTKLIENGIPNTEMMKLGKKNYEKIRKQINEIAGKNKLKPRELQQKMDEEWAEAMEEIKKINQAGDYGFAIKSKAIQDAKDFMHHKFFKNARTELQYQRIIDEYLKYLSVDKLNDIISVLTDPKFLQQWDSDQESEDYNEDWATNRQWDFIKILRNETGKNIYVNPENPHGKLKVEKWRDDGSHWRFSNFN